MSNGNKRYLGDVWINEENLNRQREFFRDIIESYQDKYGGKFDASTLQGFHAEDFALYEDGVLAKNALQSPLFLGRKSIYNTGDKQFIYTDAINIDDDNAGLVANPWFDEGMDLSQALLSIYNNIRDTVNGINSAIESKVDSDTYEEDMETLRGLSERSVEFIEETTQTQTNGFNADLVNGIRPILITEAEYNRMKNGTDKEKALINHWRNVFIFVDELPGDYNQPWEYALTDPYSFRIDNGYIQVKNNVSSNWVNMASLEDFLGGTNFDSIIQEYIEESDDFSINNTSLLTSLKNLKTNSTTTINDNWNQYPFLSSSLHDDYYYNIKINGSNDYLQSTVDSNNFKNLDINMTQLLKDKEVLTNSGANRINNIDSTLNSVAGSLNEEKSKIVSIQGQIATLQSTTATSSTDIDEIKDSLSDISNTLDSINEAIGNINKWDRYSSGMLFDDDSATLGNAHLVFVNESLRICIIYILGLSCDHKASKANQWEYTGYKIKSAYKPKSIYHGTPSNPDTNTKITNDGKIYVKFQEKTSTAYEVWTNFMYNY